MEEAMSGIRKRLFAAGLLAMISLSAAAQGWQIPQPSPGLMPNPATGRPLFEKYCAACHGLDLKGVESGTKKGPPLLHRIYEPSHHGDASFQLAAKNGVRAHHWQFGDMAPVPDVTPDDVAHITAYVRAEQRKVGIR
jgi:cytochrome c